MAAKEALLELLRNCSVSDEELREEVLKSVRKHKLGVSALAKFAKSQFRSLDPDLLGSTVESHVRSLVSLRKTLKKTAEDKHSTSDMEAYACESVGEDTNDGLSAGECEDKKSQPVTKSSHEGDSVSPLLSRTKTTTPARVPECTLEDLMAEISSLRKALESEREEAKDREIRATRKAAEAEKRQLELLQVMQKDNLALAKTVDNLNKKVSSLQSTLDKVLSNGHSPPSERKNTSANRNVENTKPRPPTVVQQSPSSDSPKPTLPGSAAAAPSTETSGQSTNGPTSWAKVSKSSKKIPSNSNQTTTPPKVPLGKLVGAPRLKKRAFYVGGIDLACSVEDVTHFCKNESCPLLDCRLVPSRRCGTQSAYVTVAEQQAESFLAISWPENLYARPWLFDDSRQGTQSTSNRTVSSPDQPSQ